MSKVINYGTISHSEKTKIFYEFMYVLLNDRVEFSVNNFDAPLI